LEHRVTRKAINEISKKLCGAEGYFSSYGVPARNLHLFDICEKNNIYKLGGIPGSQTIIDYLDQSKVPYRVYSYHDGSDSFLLESLQNDVAAGESNIFFQYLAELDSFLHNHCDDPDGIQQKLAWYEEKISDVLNTAKNMGKDVRFFLFSDHGMTPVTRHYDLIADLTAAGIDLENHCMSVFDSTMARFWVEDNVVMEKICRVLEQCPAGRIIPEEELKSLGVYFTDHRYGDLIFLMNPGTLIFPNWFGKYSPKGMHGFHPDDSHTDAVFICNVDEYAPRSILDFFDIMKREVDLQAGILNNDD
jgi:predicted AlkP superfamily pyrophosphatase or phosphodiesterase